MSNEGKVSVVLPAYNAERYITQTMNSLLVQTYANFEILVVDDCPSDRTVRIIESFDDSRIRILHNERNLGVCASRNRGIDASEGEFIFFMDHDDVVPADKLEKQVSFLQANPGMGAVGGRIQDIDSDGNIIGPFNPKVLNNPRYIRALLMFKNVFINSSVLYRSTVIKRNAIYFREDSYGLEDWLFLVEASKRCFISGIKDDVLYYRRHEGNTEKKILATQLESRHRRYNEIQRLALESEGLHLGETDFALLFRFSCDNPPLTGRPRPTVEEFAEYCTVLAGLLSQAEALGLSNREELGICVRKRIKEIAGTL